MERLRVKKDIITGWLLLWSGPYAGQWETTMYKMQAQPRGNYFGHGLP